jgi:Arc/MetJ-type ribon-helix-helix transcriptional regulator
MTIQIPASQEQWLRAQVSKGVFASVEEAVEQFIAVEMALDADDLAWAKDAVDIARKSARDGDIITLDEALQDIDAQMAQMRVLSSYDGQGGCAPV